MPLVRRVVYSAPSYGHPELHEADLQEELKDALVIPSATVTNKTILQDCNMSHLVGAIHQIAYLSSYALEVFDGLAVLADDCRDRVAQASSRVGSLNAHLSRHLDDHHHHHHHHQVNIDLLAPRDIFVPTVLSKATNNSAIQQTYALCHAPPQFWRMDKVLASLGLEPASANSVYYSNPGFFFQEWLRVEQERQIMIRADKKKEKAARKERKLERRKLRERGDQHWADLTRLGEARRRHTTVGGGDGRVGGGEGRGDDEHDGSTRTPSSIHTSFHSSSRSRSGSGSRDDSQFSRSSASSRSYNSVSNSSRSIRSRSNSNSQDSSSDDDDDLPPNSEEDDDSKNSFPPSESDSDGRSSPGSEDGSVGRSRSGSAVRVRGPSSEPSTPSDTNSNAASTPPGSNKSNASYEPPTSAASVRASASKKSLASSPSSHLASPATPSESASPISPAVAPPPPRDLAASMFSMFRKPSSAAGGRRPSVLGTKGPTMLAVAGRPSVLPRRSNFHGSKNAFVPKLTVEAGSPAAAAAPHSSSSFAQDQPHPQSHPTKPSMLTGLSSIFKTAPTTTATISEGGMGDSDDDETRTANGRDFRPSAVRPAPPQLASASASARQRTATKSVFARPSAYETIKRTESHSSISSIHEHSTQPSKQHTRPTGSVTQQGQSFMSSLTSIFRGTRSPPPPSQSSALSALDEGDEEAVGSGRKRNSSRSSLRRASIDSSPPPPSDDDDFDYALPPDSEDDNEPQRRGKSSPPGPLKSHPSAPLAKQPVRRTSGFFRRDNEKDEQSEDDFDDGVEERKDADDNYSSGKRSDSSSSIGSSSRSSSLPMAKRPLSTWMKASSSYRPVPERQRTDSEAHRKRSGTTTHARSSTLGGRKRSSTAADEDGARPSMAMASTQDRGSLSLRRSVFGDTGEAQQQHSKLHHHLPPAPPPPPPPPARRRLNSAIQNALSGAPKLRKAETVHLPKVDLRSALMGAIKKGNVALKAVEVKPIEAKVQHAAIAAILANRGKIAGSDSDSDVSDSDSDMSL